MSKFRRGQIVVVNSPEEDDRQWHLRIFKEKRPDGHFVVGGDRGEEAYQLCFPAEEIWPNIFLAVEREIAEALRNERDLHYRQIHWLCEQLQAIGDRNGSQECPPSPHQDCRRGSCAECWEVASLKAVEGESCP